LEREAGSGKERALRIVSGEFRGKTLAAPRGEATRPTSDRARQAIFNILEHAPWSEGVRDKRVIDLFAGSGALGFEALSRGAAFCLFVETDEAARGAIRDNVEALSEMGGGLFGKTLAAPRGEATRPTSDRARQAIFNILEHAPWSDGTREKRVIDIFAGSGALGFEALSRGAAFCLFVETDEAARGAIRDNVEALGEIGGGLFGKTRVHRRSAIDLGVRPGADGPAFDLAFLDPPYAKGLGETALARLAEGGWLAPGAVVVFERGSGEPDFEVDGFEKLDARDYGAARVWFLRYAG
jgi:16S rRNA (guanine966-N2)-methyltransferase